MLRVNSYLRNQFKLMCLFSSVYVYVIFFSKILSSNALRNLELSFFYNINFNHPLLRFHNNIMIVVINNEKKSEIIKIRFKTPPLFNYLKKFKLKIMK